MKTLERTQKASRAGFSLAESGALDDPDHDEWNNLLEFATVSDPSDGGQVGKPELVDDPAGPPGLLFSYRRLRALDPSHASGDTGDGYRVYGITYTVEATDDPNSWDPASSVLTLQAEGDPVDNGDGSETVTVRLTPPAGNDTRWFARLHVSQD